MLYNERDHPENGPGASETLIRLMLIPNDLLCRGTGGGRPGKRGAGDRKKGGREVYGRRERGGGEQDCKSDRKRQKGKIYAILRNISQLKKMQWFPPNKYRAGTGIKGYGKREV